MTNKYITAVDAEIKKVKERLFWLEGMRKFLIALDKPEAPVKGRLGMVPGDKHRGPAIQKQLIDWIIAVLDTAVGRPMPSYELINGLATMFSWSGKKQRVWAALAVMKKQGLVNHEDGLYSLKTNGKPNVSQA